MAKVIFFLGFLLTYGVVVALTAVWASRRESQYGEDGSWRPRRLLGRIREGQLLVLTAPAFLIYIFLLTGFFSFPLFLILAGAYEASVVGAELLAPRDAAKAIDSQAHLDWATYAFYRRAPIAFGFLGIMVVVVAFAYPIAALVVYAQHPRPSPEMTSIIFRLTLLLYVLVNYSVAAPFFVAYLTSVVVDDELRTTLLLHRLVAVLPDAITLALVFWAFQINVPGPTLGMGQVPIAVSLALVLLLLVFFVLSAVGPYLIGIQRSKSHRLMLFERARAWVDSVLKWIEVPIPASPETQIEPLVSRIDDEIEHIRENEMIAGPSQAESHFPVVRHAVWAAGVIGPSDPVFSQVQWLHNLGSELHGEKDALAGERTAKAKNQLLDRWANLYRRRLDDLDKQIDTQRQRRTPLILVSTLVGTPILSLAVSGLASWIWSSYVHVPLK